MTDFNQKNSEEEVVDAAQPSKQRRALIKGAAVAAPVVLTFRSGAAFAMTSNVAVCIPRDNAMALNKPPITTATAGADSWLRKLVYCRDLTLYSGGGGTPIKVYNDISNAEGPWLDENNIGVLGDATFRSFRKGTGSTSSYFYFEEQVGGGLGTVAYQATEAVECYILVKVHEDNFTDPARFELGNSEQIQTSQGQGYPYVTGSCWGSVDPSYQG